MPRFAANLSTLYGEFAFAERFAAAAEDGFRFVECQFPYALPAAEIAQRLGDLGLQQVLINAPPGDFAAGERGLAALPGREADFRRSVEDQALPYAKALRCPRIHVMAGRLPAGGSREALLDTLCANLAWAAPIAAREGLTLLLEPLNPIDVPGYLYSRQAEAHAVVQRVGAPNVKVQLDLYHCQRVEGRPAEVLRDGRTGLASGRVGHIQFAGVPGRHEPDGGEVDFDALFALIDELGWTQPLGAEYLPRQGTRAGLGWWRRWRGA
jgi:hydroxypyruvate isomerase